MKNKLAIIMLAALMMPVLASAGFVNPQPVVIDMDALSAQGDMHSARNSNNDDEMIGCGQRALETAPDESFNWGFCQARVEEDVTIICQTTNQGLLDAIDSIGDSSFIIFRWAEEEDGSLTCTFIGTSTQSFYLGKGKINKPGKK